MNQQVPQETIPPLIEMPYRSQLLDMTTLAATNYQISEFGDWYVCRSTNTEPSTGRPYSFIGAVPVANRRADDPTVSWRYMRPVYHRNGQIAGYKKITGNTIAREAYSAILTTGGSRHWVGPEDNGYWYWEGGQIVDVFRDKESLVLGLYRRGLGYERAVQPQQHLQRQ